MVDEASLAIRPLSVRVPSGERRNPLAMVRLAVGALVLELNVSRLRKGGLTVRPPVGEGGAPAVEAAPEVWAVIQRVAIGAALRDQPAYRHLLGSDQRRLDRATLQLLGAAGVTPPPPSAEVVPFPSGAASA